MTSSAVNGYVVAQFDTEQITQLLTQSRQGQAQLDVRRGDSSRLLHFTLVPEEMQSPSVDRTFFIGAGVGYVRVTSFDAKTAKEIKEAIEKLGGDKLAGLVLDFRNNPGGMVTTALEMSSLFLPPGIEDRDRPRPQLPREIRSRPLHRRAVPFKLAILVNEKTASASEIVAGAMQDHDRATIIGSTTFGKGLVQSVFPTSENTGLALTTALYYTPSGRSIQKPLDAEKFELGGTTRNVNATRTEFRTDKGRIVHGGGGIQPDFDVFPPQMTRFRAVLDASASFTSFATEYLRTHKITEDFEVTSQVLGEFQVYLSERRIQPGVAEWTGERGFHLQPAENRDLQPGLRGREGRRSRGPARPADPEGARKSLFSSEIRAVGVMEDQRADARLRLHHDALGQLHADLVGCSSFQMPPGLRDSGQAG